MVLRPWLCVRLLVDSYGEGSECSGAIPTGVAPSLGLMMELVQKKDILLEFKSQYQSP